MTLVAGGRGRPTSKGCTTGADCANPRCCGESATTAGTAGLPYPAAVAGGADVAQAGGPVTTRAGMPRAVADSVGAVPSRPGYQSRDHRRAVTPSDGA